MTFQQQSVLKRLPVPELADTLSLYLETIKPVATPQELQEYSQMVQGFATGLGPMLQKRLLEHEKKQKNSWIEDWWLRLAYLSWRESCLVHSNWYIIVKDHPLATPQIQKQKTTGVTDFQIYRAAGFASLFLDYKDMLDAGTIPVETTKQGPLCMHQFGRLFGITRVPKPECDILVGSHPAKSRHIVLLTNNQMFAVNVYDVTGLRISIAKIQEMFAKCARDAKTNIQPPICLLSGQHRDKWASDHIYLEKSTVNNVSFNLVETALFCVCLDHSPIPKTVTDHAKTVFHGNTGHNRWFDKSLSIVVTNDGRVGVNGEHSPCDALVPAYLVDYAATQ